MHNISIFTCLLTFQQVVLCSSLVLCHRQTSTTRTPLEWRWWHVRWEMRWLRSRAYRQCLAVALRDQPDPALGNPHMILTAERKEAPVASGYGILVHSIFRWKRSRKNAKFSVIYAKMCKNLSHSFLTQKYTLNAVVTSAQKCFYMLYSITLLSWGMFSSLRVTQ